jgi:hypothetical protein
MKKAICLILAAAALSAVTAAAQPVMSIRITDPSSGTHFAKCSDIVVTVDPQIQGGDIKNVTLYRNSVGVTARTKAPWQMKLTNAPPGYYVFIAKLTAKTGEFVYSDPVNVYVGDAEKGNILINGEFDCSQAPWTLNVSNGAIATFAIDTAAGISNGAAALITVENGGTANWHVQLQQPLAVDSGHTYIASFTAQTTQNSMPIDAMVQMNRDPWSVYSSGIGATVEALQDYGPFTFESSVTDHEAFIRFDLGNYSGTLIWLDNIKVFDVSLTGLNDRNPPGADAVPLRSLLSRNYPNPFNPGTTIQYRLPQSATVSLIIYNLKGQAVRSLLKTDETPGEHSVRWNGENERGERVPSGVYVYRLEARAAGGTSAVSRKIMMIE